MAAEIIQSFNSFRSNDIVINTSKCSSIIVDRLISESHSYFRFKQKFHTVIFLKIRRIIYLPTRKTPDLH